MAVIHVIYGPGKLPFYRQGRLYGGNKVPAIFLISGSLQGCRQLPDYPQASAIA